MAEKDVANLKPLAARRFEVPLNISLRINDRCGRGLSVPYQVRRVG
jgi:hypothetical protein